MSLNQGNDPFENNTPGTDAPESAGTSQPEVEILPPETPMPEQPETQPQPDYAAGFNPNMYDGDAAAAAARAQRERVDEQFNRMSARFDLSNKKLKIALIATASAAVLIIIAIVAILLVNQHKSNTPPPEPEFEITKPDAIGMKKATDDNPNIMADPGELSLALGTVVYEPERPSYLSYTASIPTMLQTYHSIGSFTDLNKFQATASTYSALIRQAVMEPLNLFHDIRYTDYQLQNHPEPEFEGTNYATLSGTDFYLTHNYELLMDSDGCQIVTYSYNFNLKNTARIEEYNFTEYLDCLRALTGFDLTNNDILYLIRVSMNNYNKNGESSVQVISDSNIEDYILFEQVPGADIGSYDFLITAHKAMTSVNAPDFSQPENQTPNAN